jgi:hypothetical protein
MLNRSLLAAATIVWAVAIVLAVLVGSAAVLETDPALPNIAAALGAWISALATVGLAVAAFLALGSVREARAARNAVAAMDLSRQWDSDESLDLRRRVTQLARQGPDGTAYAPPGPEAFKSSFEKLAANNDPEYGVLLRQPNFLEDIAILVKHHGIDFDIVNDSLGYNIAYWWSLWKPTVDQLRRSQPLIYKEFEQLAKRIAAIDPQLTLDARGEVLWNGFKQ